MSGALSLLPLAQQTFTDGNNLPLAGGQVTFYEPNTTTYATVYSDPAGSNPLPNPATIGPDGYLEPSGQVWGSGTFRQVVQDATGATIWDNETFAIAVSEAMAPILTSATPAIAAAFLGLGSGSIIPCNATMDGTTIALTRHTGTNPATEILGTFFNFTCPATQTGPFTISETTDSLASAELFDTLGNPIANLQENQFCVIGWNPNFGSSGAWVLLFANQGSTAVWEFTSTGTWVCPDGVNTVLCTGTGGGGAGGASVNMASGGAGGGGAQTIQGQAVSVSSGTTYQVTIGAGGIPVQGEAGGNGTATTFVSSTFSTITALAPGNGGSGGSGTADFAGGASGGAGGFAGEDGYWIADDNLANGGLGISGAGGSTLLGTGGFGRTTASTARNGGPGQGYGAGGGGGGGGNSSTGTNTGGAGAPGYFLIQLS